MLFFHKRKYFKIFFPPPNYYHYSSLPLWSFCFCCNLGSRRTTFWIIASSSAWRFAEKDAWRSERSAFGIKGRPAFSSKGTADGKCRGSSDAGGDGGFGMSGGLREVLINRRKSCRKSTSFDAASWSSVDGKPNNNGIFVGDDGVAVVNPPPPNALAEVVGSSSMYGRFSAEAPPTNLKSSSGGRFRLSRSDKIGYNHIRSNK